MNIFLNEKSIGIAQSLKALAVLAEKYVEFAESMR